MTSSFSYNLRSMSHLSQLERLDIGNNEFTELVRVSREYLGKIYELEVTVAMSFVSELTNSIIHLLNLFFIKLTFFHFFN